jgi:hypothetical protein
VRRDNWDLYVIQYAKSIIGTPLEWGETDCATIAVNAVNTMYEEQNLPPLMFNDLKTAFRFAKNADIHKLFIDLGAEEINSNYATCGDVAVGSGEDNHGLPPIYTVLRGYVLTSSEAHGVRQAPISTLPEGIRYYRFP